MGSGKSTVAAAFENNTAFHVLSMGLADPMKRFCRTLFDFSYGQLWGPSENRNAPDARYPRTGCVDGPPQLTPRYALQRLGDEWGRTCYEDIWVEYLVATARELELRGRGHDYVSPVGIHPCARPDKPLLVVVPDVRYANELRRLTVRHGAKMILVVRPGMPANTTQHQSELDMDSVPLDSPHWAHVIVNDGSVSDLQDKAINCANMLLSTHE
jgi:hypothetical protein